MTRVFAALIPLILVLAATGCAADAISDIITIRLKAKGDSAKSGVITEEKEIGTEAGNPYAAFIKLAKDEIGANPGRVELDGATLVLGANSKGVTSLEGALAKGVEVLFLVDGSKNSVTAATADKASGSGPLALDVSFDPSAMSAADRADIAAGKFKVVLRGNAAAGFDGNKDAEAEFLVAMTFSGYE